MDLIREYQRVQKYVKVLLEKYPEMRQNDELLFFTVEEWKGLIKKIDSPSLGSGYFVPLKYIKTKRLIPFSSITRARRKIQEMYPELRPEIYDKRQELAKKMKETIRKEKKLDVD